MKRKKRASLLAAEASMELFLKKVGYKGGGGDSIHPIPSYKVASNVASTSDKVCSSGILKESPKYTGTEIAGIVTTHKSNLMPVRRDNKQAAVDAAQMRRS